MKFSNDLHGWNWFSAHREQLRSISRATPTAMAGYAINIALAAIAFRDATSPAVLVLWTVSALAICSYVAFRAIRRTRFGPEKLETNSPVRSARNALLFSFLLALPWSTLGAMWAGDLGANDIIVVALVIGMAASGSVLLTPIPAAASLYAVTILLPVAVKSLFLTFEGHFVLGALTLSYLAFLIALIASSYRVFAERLEAVEKLRESVDLLTSAREETERAAMTDGLTGVANRRAFMTRLATLASDRSKALEHGVFYIDLDRFKSVNDTLGHAAGDDVLKTVALRISKVVRSEDLVARLGGDEFAVVAHGIPGRATASVFAKRLVTALSEPFVLEGQRLEVGASVGVSIASESDADGDLLLKQADLAMYAGKSMGQGSYCIFEADMLHSAQERRIIELGLRKAVVDDELELHFQPIRQLAKNKITGFECLVRWRHPSRGILPPGQFLNIADELGMANEIGGWVIDNACAQAAKWNSDIVIGINLSPQQIASDDVARRVERALKASGIAANRLEIEITETSLLRNDPVTLDQLRKLKELGVSIALDDFGTGYSSLSYLVSFPFDRIKIDRLFISELGRSRESDLVVRSIAQLAKNLNYSVVAEGIETDEQLQKLRALHVGYGQGYLFGHPVPAHVADKLLCLTPAPRQRDPEPMAQSI